MCFLVVICGLIRKRYLDLQLAYGILHFCNLRIAFGSRDRVLVDNSASAYALRLVGIPQSGECLVVVGRCDACDHRCFAVAAERVLQQPC